MLQIVIPMAGAGSRFAVAGYADPKPLIPLFGVPMIKVVIDTAQPVMIAKNLRVNNEFYIAPAYNEMIGQGARVMHCSIGGEGQGMYGVGIPADLQLFLSLPISLQATSRAAR